MFILNTGNGKGKTTAAIGQTIRALGRGKKVFFIQFIKSEGYPSGEDEILRGFGDKVKFIKGGKGFVGILGDTLPKEEHAAAARESLSMAKEAVASGEYGLIVLDEANVALGLELISLDGLIDVLELVPPECDIIFTGRGAVQELIDRADIVTECAEIKHPFNEDVKAKKGVEY